MPHTAPDAKDYDAGYDLNGQAEDNWQNVAPSPMLDDRMFGQDSMGGQQSEGCGNESAEHTSTSQQSASEESAGSLVARASQPFAMPDSQQEAIKRRAAKRATLAGVASPARTVDSPSRAYGLQHDILGGM